VRRSFESARAEAQAGAADYQNVLLTLTAEVAVNYFLLRSLDAQIAVLRRAVELREESAQILRGRFTAGAIPEIDAAQAATEAASARADLADTARQRAETVDALALLCGKPASTFGIAGGPLRGEPPGVPIGLPSTVLERRPDIAAAERTLASRNAQIGVARAAYFPVVHLTGQAGFLSGDASTLFAGDSFAWSLGPGVSFPVFTAGRTAATVKQAQSSYQEALANFRQTAFSAFKEVEDSLAQITFWTQQAAAQTEALTAARRVTALTRARYEAGVLTYFDVVNAQRDELQFERQDAQLAASRFAAVVRLIKSLGGGWEQAANDVH
jgi:multidrug efflux system outer membrane protein